ncbi:MAG: hypothetical protein HZB79_06900 [Deltaproteobacteria bacterium]|nr:hypothetical protein [Deltaproteobacteria bacterium]
MKSRLVFLLISILASIYGCVTPGLESFNLGQDLAKNDRLEEAIVMLEDAVNKEPQNTQYLESLSKAKETLAARYLEKARSILAQTPLTYDRVMSAHQEVEKAVRLMPKGKDAENLAAKVKSELDGISRKAETLYADAAKAVEKNQWADAVKKLREINRFYPNYLDVSLKLKQVEDNGVSYYLKEAERFKKTEDWGDTIKSLTFAREIMPEKVEITDGLKEAASKHKPDYYFSKAEEYSKKGDWDTAISFLEKASRVGLDAEKASLIRQHAAQYYIDQGNQYLAKKRLYSAYSSVVNAMNYGPSIKGESGAANVIKQLLGAMAEKAAAYDSQGFLGNAFVWYEKIMTLNQDYPDLFFKMQSLKDRIRNRVIRKIAIMDFSPPSGNSDAGKIVTDSLLSYITVNASTDVKILARDVLGAILKEIELGQAGLYDIESAKKAGKLQGTDVFIFGSVLNYNVDKNVSEGYKIENVVTGKKTIQNPSYQMWLMSLGGRRPTDEDLKNAPPTNIIEEIRETVKYKVGTEKKRATIGVSFRVIDLEQGEVVITKTIKKSHEVKDDYSEGVAFANIKFDPLEIPSDSEIIEKVTQDIVAELGHEVLSRFQNLQTQYFGLGEMYKKKREYEKAIEKYSDAINLEDMKNVSGPLSENARKEIEQLLKQVVL